jgi:glycosyltransferase involved in cell wall biosynthesis
LYKKITRRKEVPYSGFANEEAKVSFVQKVARFVRGNFFFPDARKGWNAHAYAKAVELIQKEGVSTWITTSPPNSTQLVGLKLKNKYPITWISDFRDPWTDIYYYDLFYPTALTRFLEKRMERNVLQRCDHFITVSPSWIPMFEKNGLSPLDKVLVLPNGYDAADFKELKKERPSTFTITYAGTFTAQYPVEDLVSALNQVDRPMTLKIIGKWDQASEQQLQQLNANIQLELVSYLPKSELLQQTMNSHLMLLMLPRAGSVMGIVPGKLFEYMATLNPTLCLGPIQSDAASYLSQTNSGQSFDFGNVNGIAAYVNQQMNLGAPEIDGKAILHFERKAQAQRIAGLLH